MFTLNVKIDTKPVIDHLNAIKKGLGDQAITSALNDTAAQARTQMIRGITATYAIPASLVRERLSLSRASRNGLRFTATLIGNPNNRAKRSMNLIHFIEKSVTLAQAKKRRKDDTLNTLRVQILKAGGKKLLPGAFIGNKGRTVFMRTGPGRLPIVPVQTVGVPQMFSAHKVQDPVTRWIRDNFPRIFESKAKYFLSTVK